MSKLCAIDIKVHAIDPAWPISELTRSSASTAAVSTPLQQAITTAPVKPVVNSIHVNPKFLVNKVNMIICIHMYL